MAAETDKQTADVMWSPIQKDVLALLEKNGSLTREQLVTMTNKPRTTLYDNLMELIHHKIVKKYPIKLNGRGRPIVKFALNYQR